MNITFGSTLTAVRDGVEKDATVVDISPDKNMMELKIEGEEGTTFVQTEVDESGNITGVKPGRTVHCNRWPPED